MRKQLLITVAAVAMTGPAFAADLSGGYIPPSGDIAYSPAPVSTVPAVVGDIELSLGWQHFNPDDCDLCLKSFGDFNNFAFSGWARANVDMGNWNLLVETGGNAFFGGDFPSGKSFSAINAFAHVWGGNGGFRYGAFGGATFGLWSLTWGSVGGEVEADFGNSTLGAQGFYSWASPPGPGDLDVYGANAWWDYYFTSNTKFTLVGQWAHLEAGGGIGGGDADILGATARLTHRFAGSPFNVFVEGQYANFDVSGPGPAGGDAYAAVAGITINLDGGLTQEQLDKEAAFSFRGPLPQLGLSF